jgi:phospholipid/cholesterol/gamma-HCH transport system permease protein
VRIPRARVRRSDRVFSPDYDDAAGAFDGAGGILSFDTRTLGGYTLGAVPDQTTIPAAPVPAPDKNAPLSGVIVGEAADALEEAGGITGRFVRDAVIGLFVYLGGLMSLFFQAIRSFGRLNAVDVVRQMSTIGVDTIPIAVMTVGFSGAVLSLYTTNTLAGFGIPSLVGGIVALSIFRETGPILVGVVAAARAGSAMTAEIGSMKVTEQIDALRSMAISPIDYLVAPRVLAALVMLPIVTLFADAAGTFGGEIVAFTKGVSPSAYSASVHQLLDPKDIFGGLAKTVVFGIIIALIGCGEGLQSEGGAAGVGQSTTRSVVLSIVLIFIANFILSFLLYNASLV